MPTGLQIGTIAIGLLGGLALFLFGLDQMSSALKAITGDRMRSLLSGLTSNRFTGVLTGALTTAVMQSSSITTVLVVGFVSAGLMTLAQSIGVIMGANIGTTITAQIIAFNITEYALGLIAIGFAVLFLAKQERIRQTGSCIMALGLVFFGMAIMSQSTTPLRDHQPFIDAMKSMSHPVLGMLVGAVFTALVQSSSATIGIVIVLASQGFITLEAGIALALGANVGSCVTAILAAPGKPADAKRAATVHVLFNVVGVLVWLGFIHQLADWVRAISPAFPELAAQQRAASEVPRQIANAHTLFNVANTILFIGFTGQLEKFVSWLIPDKPVPLPKAAQPHYLDPVYLDTPALAVDRLRMETGHLGQLTLDIMDMLRGDEGRRATIKLHWIEERARDVELLSGEILSYARKLAAGKLTEADLMRLERTLDTVNQLRAISDTVATNLSALFREWQSRQLQASDQTRKWFLAVHDKVAQAIRSAISATQETDPQLARQVIDMKRDLYDDIDSLARHLSARLMSQDPDRIEIYRLESRVLEILRRLYYFAKRVAKTVADDVTEPAENRATAVSEN